MQKLLKTLFLVLVLYLTIFLVINPTPCLSAAKNAIALCLDTVIPALFPFFVLSTLLTVLGFSTLCSRFLSPIMRPLFNIPGCGALTFFMGILSGYPVGASIASNLYATGQCTKSEAERMLAFCNNSGPLFVIGVVGSSYFGNPTLGKYLYASHIIAAILVGMLFRFYKGSVSPIRTLPPSVNANKKTALLSLGGIIDSSVFSTLKVCGFVIFFAVFTQILPQTPLLYSTIEIIGGLKALSRFDSPITLPLISFFLAFSGLSVIFQVSSITTPHGLSLKPYLMGKVLQGILSFSITRIMLNVFPIAHETFAYQFSESLPFFTPLSLFSSAVISSLLTALVLCILMLLFTLIEQGGCAARRRRRS